VRSQSRPSEEKCGIVRATQKKPCKGKGVYYESELIAKYEQAVVQEKGELKKRDAPEQAWREQFTRSRSTFAGKRTPRTKWVKRKNCQKQKEKTRKLELEKKKREERKR